MLHNFHLKLHQLDLYILLHVTNIQNKKQISVSRDILTSVLFQTISDCSSDRKAQVWRLLLWH